MSRYRKTEIRMWGDRKFRSLSPLKPSGQALWLFLLIGPFTGPIPGLYKAGRAAIAEELGWTLEAFDEAFDEAFRLGMVKADWQARLVWIPNAIKHNKPESPNVVISWRSEFEVLPECKLKWEAHEFLGAHITRLGKAFSEAFAKAFGEATPKAMPNQEQEQEQKQKQYQEQYKTLVGFSPDACGCSADNPENEITETKPNKKRSRKTKQDDEDTRKVIEAAIDHLNHKTGSRFTTAEANAKFIRARIAEGATLHNLCAVIDKKVAEWLDHPKMRHYLRPATLFNAEKFHQYAGQLNMQTEADDWAEYFADAQHNSSMRDIDGEVIRHDS